MQLTQETITKAAIEILNDYGLADMTMRRMAKRLEVAPGALYWHFPNKQALISAISQRILAPILPTDTNPANSANPVASYKTAELTPAELCVYIRQCLLKYRDGAELVNAALSQEGLRETLETILTTSVNKQYPHTPSPSIGATTLLHFVMGATMNEQSAVQLVKDTNPFSEQVAAKLDETTAAFHNTFNKGLEIIINGLATNPNDSSHIK